MSWVNAVKEFAKQNGGNYLIPKRGTPEYEKVKEIQSKLSLKEPEPVAKKPVKRKDYVPEDAGITVVAKKPKVKKVEAVAVEAAPEPEQPKITIVRKKKQAPNERKVVGRVEVEEKELPVAVAPKTSKKPLKAVEAKPTPVIKTKKERLQELEDGQEEVVVVKKVISKSKIVEAKPMPVIKTRKESLEELKQEQSQHRQVSLATKAKKALEETKSKLRISHEPTTIEFD
jgi:hypothetical protein